VLALSLFNVSIQLSAPRWVVGRALSLYQTATFGGMAAGSWIWGTVAQSYSLTSSLELAACALVVVGALGFVLPVLLGADGDQQGSEFPAPQLALDLKPRSGPIAARTVYLIAEESLETFLRHMRARRFAMSRAGARDWTLQRDLRNPAQWAETFRTPTWMDFMRLNHRLSPADQEISELLCALHRGDRPLQTDLAIERATDAPVERARFASMR
jgi:hypothetical protein